MLCLHRVRLSSSPKIPRTNERLNFKRQLLTCRILPSTEFHHAAQAEKKSN